MIREFTRLPVQQPLVTGGVAAAHFASEAAVSYLEVIGTQLLISGPVRSQAAGRIASLLLLDAGSARLQSHWRQNLELAFQTSIVPFLRDRCALDTSARHVPSGALWHAQPQSCCHCGRRGSRRPTRR